MAKENFEKAVLGLEKAVENLEREDLGLEEALRWFEQGVERLAVCRKVLQEAENRIELLLKERDGRLRTQPFEDDGVES